MSSATILLSALWIVAKIKVLTETMTFSVLGTPSIHSKHTGTPTSLEKMMSFHTYTTLTTETSTGTDITSANNIITQYHQISSRDRCLVFGNPKLPERYI